MQYVSNSSTHMLFSATGSAFAIGRPLGNGGMGRVFLAERTDSTDGQRQLVALKILRPDAPQQARRLFYHEGTLLPRLQHYNIVQAVERGRGAIAGVGAVDYLALAYIAGETLESLLRQTRRPLPPQTVLGICAQVGQALSYLHQRGIVHCDLKPGNIMLERAAPRALLLDFGIARAPDFVGQPVAVGTPQYMAPEQADPQALCDGRADLYALGVVICELLTGRRLFPNRTTTDIRRGAMLTPDHSQLAAMMPHPIAEMLVRCLAANPDDRYQSAEALLEDLRLAVQQVMQAQGGATQEGCS